MYSGYGDVSMSAVQKVQKHVTHIITYSMYSGYGDATSACQLYRK